MAGRSDATVLGMAGARAEQTLQDYLEAWNEPDEATRRKLLEGCWAEDAIYTDPSVHVEGREALVHHARKFAERWPGAHVALTSGIEEHHGMMCFTWHVVGVDGEPLRHGIDFAELAPDGRLQRIVGFFGRFARLD